MKILNDKSYDWFEFSSDYKSRFLRSKHNILDRFWITYKTDSGYKTDISFFTDLSKKFIAELPDRPRVVDADDVIFIGVELRKNIQVEYSQEYYNVWIPFTCESELTRCSYFWAIIKRDGEYVIDLIYKSSAKVYLYEKFHSFKLIDNSTIVYTTPKTEIKPILPEEFR